MAKFAPSIEKLSEKVYLVLAYDDESNRAVRETNLDEHLEFIEMNYKRYLTCGPLRLPEEKKNNWKFFYGLC